MTLLIAFLVSPLNYLQMIQISSYLGNLLIWKIFTRLSLSQSSEDNDPGRWRACFPMAHDPVSLSPYILMWLTQTCRLLKHLYREAYRPAVKRLSNNWQLVKLPAVWVASRSTFPFPAHWDAAVGTRLPREHLHLEQTVPWSTDLSNLKKVVCGTLSQMNSSLSELSTVPPFAKLFLTFNSILCSSYNVCVVS